MELKAGRRLPLMETRKILLGPPGNQAGRAAQAKPWPEVGDGFGRFRVRA